MAKKSMIARDEKRVELAAKYTKKRAELRRRIRDPQAGLAERMEAAQALADLPRDSSPSRQRRRCKLTGRSRGTYRKFGLAHSKVREVVMRGDAPGVSMASW
ncbi:MAG TPA: 30S ribosomal protein S14 [Gammaproteobacteria bacterium]|nr:30S ribosomal protein S14 [Gammaproteobacteria bacterium]